MKDCQKQQIFGRLRVLCKKMIRLVIDRNYAVDSFSLFVRKIAVSFYTPLHSLSLLCADGHCEKVSFWLRFFCAINRNFADFDDGVAFLRVFFLVAETQKEVEGVEGSCF